MSPDGSKLYSWQVTNDIVSASSRALQKKKRAAVLANLPFCKTTSQRVELGSKLDT
jgi:hypothetical protein